MKRVAFWLSLCILSITLAAGAQTIGGDTALTSKTWTFSGLTTDLPSTVLWTPAVDGDFLVSAYVDIPDNMSNCVMPMISYTDEFGNSNIQSFWFSSSPGLIAGQPEPYEQSRSGSGAVIQIHAMANTPVSVSALANVCGGGGTASFDIIIGKIKINP